eukprot:scaffold89075_cov36-Attheya_sp.AAC.4
MKVVVVGVVTLGLSWTTQAFAPIPSFGHSTTKNHNVARYASTRDGDGPRKMGGYLDGLSPNTETKWKVSEKEEKTEMEKDSVIVEASTATTEQLAEETKDVVQLAEKETEKEAEVKIPVASAPVPTNHGKGIEFWPVEYF